MGTDGDGDKCNGDGWGWGQLEFAGTGMGTNEICGDGDGDKWVSPCHPLDLTSFLHKFCIYYVKKMYVKIRCESIANHC